MKQLGHYGTALLLYSPVALSSSFREQRDGACRRGARHRAGDGTGLRPLPSVRGPPRPDSHVRFRDSRRTSRGRGGWIVGSQVDAATARTFGRFGFAVGALTVVSHLLADVITPMGIRPFWPLSDRHFTLDLVYAKNWAANVLLFVLGTTATLLVVFASRGS